jgi:hypothetical protein
VRVAFDLCPLEASMPPLSLHVVTTAGFESGLAGTTRFVAQRGGARYLRVDLASTLTPDLQVVILAHELQHACEVARSTAASSRGVRALDHEIGKAVSGHPDMFETAAAVRTGHRVRRELRTGRGGVSAVEE